MQILVFGVYVIDDHFQQFFCSVVITRLTRGGCTDCYTELTDETSGHQGFQYFSSPPVLHYLQAVLFI